MGIGHWPRRWFDQICQWPCLSAQLHRCPPLHSAATPRNLPGRLMKLSFRSAAICLCALPAAAQLEITSFAPGGPLTVGGVFSNGVCTVETADEATGPWLAARNVFTTGEIAQASVSAIGAARFYRALAVDLSNGRAGFTNLVESYNQLTTMAGAG